MVRTWVGICVNTHRFLWPIMRFLLGIAKGFFFFFFFLHHFFVFSPLSQHHIQSRVPLSVLGDPNPIDAEAVRNTKGASVGDVVGDGIQFVYEETGFVDFKTEIKRGTREKRNKRGGGEMIQEIFYFVVF